MTESHTRIDKNKRQAKRKSSVAVNRYIKSFSSQNDDYLLEVLPDKRDLVKLKRGIIKEQEKRERKGSAPIKDLDAFMLQSVRGGDWKSFTPGYKDAKQHKSRKSETEEERLDKFRKTAEELQG